MLKIVIQLTNSKLFMNCMYTVTFFYVALINVFNKLIQKIIAILSV